MITCRRNILMLIFVVVTCSSDADCSGQSCNSGFVSKCNSQNQCQCLLKSTCSVDTDCSNRCISGYTATCSNGHCQCHAHKGTLYYVDLYASFIRRHYVYTFTFFSLFCIFIGRGGITFIFIELQSRNGLIA